MKVLNFRNVTVEDRMSAYLIFRVSTERVNEREKSNKE